jgi:uncharacterized membrane protein YcaP (DUF421 family)
MEWFEELTGLYNNNPRPEQMAFRAIIIFIASFFLLRVSGIRLLGKQTNFDNMSLLMLGAILGRSIVTGSLLGSLLAASVVVLLHRGVAWVTFKSTKSGKIIKGDKVLLWKDGMLMEENLAKLNVTQADIMEAMRVETHETNWHKFSEINMERSGRMSFLKKKIDEEKLQEYPG